MTPITFISGRQGMKTIFVCWGMLGALAACDPIEVEVTVPNADPASMCSAAMQQHTVCDWTTTPIKGGSAQIKALDAKKQVIVGLQIQGDIDLGGTKISTKENSGFVAKLTANGKHIWSRGCKNIESIPSIAADENNNVVFMAGAKTNQALTDCLIDLQANLVGPSSPKPISQMNPTQSAGDVIPNPVPPLSFVVTFDENGVYRWHRTFKRFKLRANFDGQHHLIVSGYENGVSDNCNGDECIENHDGTTDASWFISKFDASGNRLWTKRFPKQTDTMKPIDNLVHAVNRWGDIFVALSFRSFTDILDHPVESIGERNILAVRLIPQKPTWPAAQETVEIAEMRQLVGKGLLEVTDITIAADGLPIIIGTFGGTLHYKDEPSGDEWIQNNDDESRVYMAKPLTGDNGQVFLKKIGMVSASSGNLHPNDFNVLQASPRVYPLDSEILVSGVSDEPTLGCPAMFRSALLRYTDLGERNGEVAMPPINGPSPLNIATTPDGQVFFGGNFSLECGVEKTDEVLQVGHKKVTLTDDDYF